MSPAPIPPPIAAADRPPAPPFAEAAGQVMVRQLLASLRGRRFVSAALLVAFPPILTAAMANPDLISLTRVVVSFVLSVLLPLTALALGSGILQEEGEEGTLTYLFTSPVHRSAIVLGKWASALVIGWGLALASLGATFLLSPVDLEPLGPFVKASLIAALLGFPAYLGIFTLCGILFRRGYIGGLLYAFGFELVLWLVPGTTKRLSIGHFLRSLLEPTVKDKTPFETSFSGLPADPAWLCIAVLLSVALATVAATLLVVPKKEFGSRNVQG